GTEAARSGRAARARRAARGRAPSAAAAAACGRRPRGDARPSHRLDACDRRVSRTRDRRSRLDRGRAGTRTNPRRKRCRRYHHRRSTDRFRGYLHDVKRLAPLAIALLAAGVFAALALADGAPPPVTVTTPTTTAPATVVPDGVTLAGVQIGGLAPDAAQQAVTAMFDQPVTLRFGTTRIVVSPTLLGVSASVDTAVAKALTVAPNTVLTMRASVDQSLVRAFVAKLANRFNRKPVSSQLLLRGVRPDVTPAAAGEPSERKVAARAVRGKIETWTRSAIGLG